MANYISAAPIWIIVLFILSFFLSIIFISDGFRKAAVSGGMTPSKSRQIQLGIVGFYIIYLAYVASLALRGILDSKSLPPTVMVYAALPLMIFLFAVIGNTRLFKNLLRAITLESLIMIHVFRVLGVFFIFLYYYQLLPGKFAFSAGLGDIITAILAIPVAKAVAKRISWRIPLVYAWNCLGMFDIVNLLVIATMIGKQSVVAGAAGIREMTLFPFSWFPAFAPPTILFLHIAVFRKLRYQKNSSPII